MSCPLLLLDTGSDPHFCFTIIIIIWYTEVCITHYQQCLGWSGSEIWGPGQFRELIMRQYRAKSLLSNEMVLTPVFRAVSGGRLCAWAGLNSNVLESNKTVEIIFWTVTTKITRVSGGFEWRLCPWASHSSPSVVISFFFNFVFPIVLLALLPLFTIQ